MLNNYNYINSIINYQQKILINTNTFYMKLLQLNSKSTKYINTIEKKIEFDKKKIFKKYVDKYINNI